MLEKQDLIKVLFSILIGTIIGAEREYRSKTAGFKTMGLICLGATLFTIFSLKLGGVNNPDRIASNILTGIGFIGAGVIFKDAGNLVSGLTTATAIWITAALGIGVGIGEFMLCGIASISIIVILTIFPYMERFIDAYHEVSTYKVWISDRAKMAEIEQSIKRLNLKIRTNKHIKDNKNLICSWNIGGSAVNHNLLRDRIFNDAEVEKFEF